MKASSSLWGFEYFASVSTLAKPSLHCENIGYLVTDVINVHGGFEANFQAAMCKLGKVRNRQSLEAA